MCRGCIASRGRRPPVHRSVDATWPRTAWSGNREHPLLPPPDGTGGIADGDCGCVTCALPALALPGTFRRSREKRPDTLGQDFDLRIMELEQRLLPFADWPVDDWPVDITEAGWGGRLIDYQHGGESGRHAIHKKFEEYLALAWVASLRFAPTSEERIMRVGAFETSTQLSPISREPQSMMNCIGVSYTTQSSDTWRACPCA